MSNPSTNGLQIGMQRADFWELTNFGTNEVDLTGYRWLDGDAKGFDFSIAMPETIIAPGKSIIIVNKPMSVIPDPAAFRAWWGPGLPADLQIYFSNRGPGFDADNGDATRLWDAHGRLVDEVSFGPGLRGVTITYDLVYGAFSEPSTGSDGAFSSTEGADIGSPGIALLGQVPVRITQEPVSQIVDAGSEVVLRVQATGRPAPKYRWYHNGLPVPSAAITASVPRLVCYAGCGPSWERLPGPNDFTISQISPDQSGNYFVDVFNGLTTRRSQVITVTVNTNPTPVQVDCPSEPVCEPGIGQDPLTLFANPGQTAIFTVRTRGFPVPTFQWSSSADGVTFTDVPGATNRDLIITDITSFHDCHYRVRTRNSSGTLTAAARLSVQPRPQLAITEVMAQACIAPNRDWWELTNIGAEPVNLCGYRWDDHPSNYSIGGGPTITNSVLVRPGESVILLESQRAEDFVRWWGAANLPPHLRFITYAANGLDDETGDSIRLWPPNETDISQWIALADFSAPSPGKSRWWDSNVCTNVDEFGNPVGEFGIESVIGQCNAFQAEHGCEIGSPGWTRWTAPALTSVVRERARCTLSWKAQANSVNRLQFARRLAAAPEAVIWEDLGEYRFPDVNCVAIDESLGSEPQRFYRISQISLAECLCIEAME